MSINKKYKRNYLEAIKTVVPSFYFAEEYSASGNKRSATDSLVNSHISFCVNQPTILDISATKNLSSIGEVSGLSKWFIPTNNLTNITSRKFELEVLHPLGYCAGEYTGKTCTFFTSGTNNQDFSSDQKATFTNFLKSTILPLLSLNSPTLLTDTSSIFATTTSGTHEFLADTLGWAYFLNTSGVEYSPSAYVASAIADTYFDDTVFDTAVGVEGVTTYTWKDWAALSATYPSILPVDYVSGVGTYVSGNQALQGLKSLLTVIYSNQYLNEGDTYVTQAFEDFLTTGDLLTGQELAGPFSRFIQSISYSFFDTNNEVSKLATLNDIEKCPKDQLPYLADLIGWTLYGSDSDSWRRQIRGAVTLYKQKGTKKGLLNALTTVLPTVNIQASAISEFYESYIPNLLYYLIKTDTTIFDSFDSFDYQTAQEYIPGDYDSENMDANIRKVVDWMLLKALSLFPDLFYIRNFKFDLTNPKFQFFYRGRAFPIPPWEEEKFYASCDVTEDLITFFKRELACLGVQDSNSEAFGSHVLDNTIRGSVDTKFYDNGFFFLTSSLADAPNKQNLLDTYQVDKYDYLSIWNGKSSHFDVDVSSGSFDATFFQGEGFLKQDFFQALAIVDKFSPSKAIPRTRVNLDNTENVSSLDFICPSLRLPIYDIPLSGNFVGAYDDGVDIRGVPGAFGKNYPTPANSSRARNDHTSLPVYARASADNRLGKISLMGSSIDQSPLELLFRTNTRRRNFDNTLEKGGLYTRTGHNMPNYFNTSSAGTDVEFQPLGYLNVVNRYHTVHDPLNLYEVSAYPDNLDVWNECWGLDSTKTLSGIAASSTFDIRGSSDITVSSCNSYVSRERTPDFYKYLYTIVRKNLEYESNFLVDTNGFLLDPSSYMDAYTTVYNKLWNDSSLSEADLYDMVLGQRRFSRGSKAGIHKTFKDYITYYQGQGTGNSLLHTQKDGGLNILSHAYGPLLYNGNFNIDGSSIGVSSQLVGKALSEESPFSVKDLGNNITASAVSSLAVEGGEYRNPYVLSGVEFTDSLAGTSKFTIFDFDASTSVENIKNYLVNNPIVLCKPSEGLSRLRYTTKDYGPTTNLLVPEHDFTFSLNAAIGRDDSMLLGGGSYGVWIHTPVEYDNDGTPVFWTFTPNGEWEIGSPSQVSGVGGIKEVRNSLSHTLTYNESYSASGDGGSCFLTSTSKDVLGTMGKGDFRSTNVSFNTKNSPIKVPLTYYQLNNKVHRANQNYIIEVFMYTPTDTTKFGIIDGISVVDRTQNDRLHRKHTFNYTDYSQAKDYIKEDYQFITQQGDVVPVGTRLQLNSSGDISSEDGGKVTYKPATNTGSTLAKVILYSQVKAEEPKKWIEDANGTISLLNAVPYTGTFLIDSNSTVSPPNITIEGKTKGSNIVKEKTLYIPYIEEETLAVLREFNRLQKELRSREATISSTRFGSQGGARSVYDVAPMWALEDGHNSFVSDYNQYTNPLISNTVSIGNRQAWFRLPNPTRYDNFPFLGAGEGAYNQISIYPNHTSADANGYVYYDIKIDLDYPAKAGTQIVYDISGSGEERRASGHYLIQTPWSIVGGYESPLSVGAGNKEATIRVRLDASAGISTWNEYRLIFHIKPDDAASVGIYTRGPQSYTRSDEFRLDVKTALVSSVVVGTTPSGCEIPPVIWFDSSLSTQTVVAPGSLSPPNVYAITAGIQGASGPGLPKLNEKCYWYWKALPGGSASGTTWFMCDAAGTEVSQGEYELTGVNPKVYMAIKNGFSEVSVSAHYERVDLSSQGASSYTMVSAVDRNGWTNTSAWHGATQHNHKPTRQKAPWTNPWPDEPLSGDYISNSKVFRNPIFNAQDPRKVSDSQGVPLRVQYFTSSFNSDINFGEDGKEETKTPYLRKSLAGQYYCDGEEDYFPIKQYSMFAIKMQDPSMSSFGLNLDEGPGTHYGPAYGTRLSLRDKGSNVQNCCPPYTCSGAGCFPDPGKPGGGEGYYNGDPGVIHKDSQSQAACNFLRNPDTGYWAFYENDTNGQNAPEVSGGVVSGTDLSGNKESILWIVRNDVTSSARMAEGGTNCLLRPLWYEGNLKNSLDGGWGALSGATCSYDPFFRNYASATDPAVNFPPEVRNLVVNNILPQFWPILYNQWEPRGGLMVPKPGSPGAASFSPKFKLTI